MGRSAGRRRPCGPRKEPEETRRRVSNGSKDLTDPETETDPDADEKRAKGEGMRNRGKMSSPAVG